MKFKILYWVILLMMAKISMASVKPEELVKNFDIRAYAPQKHGLKDLVVNIKVPGLQEKLNKAGNLGKINNLYFTLYWSFPDKLKIITHGLSPKLNEIQNTLAAEIAGHIGTLLPLDLEQQTKGMKYNHLEESSQEKSIIATDSSGKRAINQLNIYFDNQGILSSIESFGLAGRSQTQFTYKIYPWSNNKYALSVMLLERPINGNKLKTSTEIFYKNQDGFGLPEKIKVTVELVGEKKSKRQSDVELAFSDYKINSGLAAKELMKGAAETNAN